MMMGRVMYRLLPVRRKVVLGNMRQVFGDTKSADEIRALAERFYDHLAQLFFENLSLGWMNESRLRERIRVDNVEHILDASKLNKGILLLTGHFGNWELAPIGSLAHFPQFKHKFHVLRRTLGNKFIERIVFNRFYRAGLNVIPKRGSIDTVLEKLSQNEVVVFILDQYARPGKEGVEVEFFGRKAGTFKSLAMVARSTDAPVIPVVCYREGRGRHVIQCYPPVKWIERSDPDEEILVNTREYNRVLEKMILDHPDQWLWAHKRWKVK